jgi:hypothetical protein
MTANPLKERLIAEIRDKDTRELATDHVRKVELAESDKRAEVYVDKRYAINLFHTHGHAVPLVEAVRKAFGPEFSASFRLVAPHHGHDREMLVPYTIHIGG